MSIFYGTHGKGYSKNQLSLAYIIKFSRWMILSSYDFLKRKFIHIDIRDTDSYSHSYSLFQIIAHSKPTIQ